MSTFLKLTAVMKQLLENVITKILLLTILLRMARGSFRLKSRMVEGRSS
jgi:hypothetical protein